MKYYITLVLILLTMGTPKTKKRKRKGRIKVKTGARIVKKDSVKNDTLPKVQGRPPASVAPVMRVKIRKKQ